MTRRYGRAGRGQRVPDAIPKNYGSNVTVLGALSCGGIDAVMTIDGATDSAVFRAYVAQVLYRRWCRATSLSWTIWARIKSKACEKPSSQPAPLCFTCRLIHRIGHRSKIAGPNSRPRCAPPKPARPRYLIPHSNRRSTPSPLRMPEAGLRTAAIPYSESQFAVGAASGLLFRTHLCYIFNSVLRPFYLDKLPEWLSKFA